MSNTSNGALCIHRAQQSRQEERLKTAKASTLLKVLHPSKRTKNAAITTVFSVLAALPPGPVPRAGGARARRAPQGCSRRVTRGQAPLLAGRPPALTLPGGGKPAPRHPQGARWTQQPPLSRRRPPRGAAGGSALGAGRGPRAGCRRGVMTGPPHHGGRAFPSQAAGWGRPVGRRLTSPRWLPRPRHGRRALPGQAPDLPNMADELPPVAAGGLCRQPPRPASRAAARPAGACGEPAGSRRAAPLPSAPRRGGARWGGRAAGCPPWRRFSTGRWRRWRCWGCGTCCSSTRRTGAA